jgi:hypothetical protein
MAKMRSVEGSLEDEVEVGNPGRTGVGGEVSGEELPLVVGLALVVVW